MLTKEQAKQIVGSNLNQSLAAVDVSIVDEETIERTFGWVFFYQSTQYLRTGNFSDRLAGNGPVLVNKHSGEIVFGSSSVLPSQFIEDYEKRLAQER